MKHSFIAALLAGLALAPGAVLLQAQTAPALEVPSPDAHYRILARTVAAGSDELVLLDQRTQQRVTLSDTANAASYAGGGFVWMNDSSGFYLVTTRERSLPTLAFYNMASASFLYFDHSDAPVREVLLCGDNQRYLVWSVEREGYLDLYSQDRLTKQITYAEFLPEGRPGAACPDGGRMVQVPTIADDQQTAIWQWDLQRDTAAPLP